MLGEWEAMMYPSCMDIAYKLYNDVNLRRQSGEEIFPKQNDIFRALLATSPHDVKVVILGQDPYSGVFQANGLAFSSTDKVKIPPSLQNIYAELESDLGIKPSESGDLSKWASNGVLLLNSVLTVQHGYPMSHGNLGWQRVTREVLNVCIDVPQPVVFLAWGAFAIREISSLDMQGKDNKFRLYSSHPSPLGSSYSSDTIQAFSGSRPFSTANRLLESAGSTPVDWSLL